MKTHDDLIQGSPEWIAFRAAHFPASEAPSMLGESPYKSRTQLLHEKHTGLTPEVDAATQRRFDDGHRFENLARPLAEEIIGEPLSPVTGSDGMLSASFDGITFAGDIIFEHKSLNDEIGAAKSAADLGLHYRIQMEQQLLVSGAEKCLFMATNWNSGDELQEQVFHWYYPDMDLRSRIVAGWEQFAKDLAAYTPRDIPEKPKADAILALPALAIQIRGEVTLSNLPAFKEAAESFIANINTTLQTDDDFAQAEATVKFCKEAEDDLDAAKKSAIAQTASIDELMRTIDHIQSRLRDKRLILDRAVKTQKEAIKAKIVMDAQQAFKAHCAQLDDELRGLGVRLVAPSPDFAGAMKNKRTLTTLHDAVDTALAAAKIEAGAIAQDVRGKMRWFKDNGGSQFMFLFADLQSIAYKPEDDFKLMAQLRIEKHREAEAQRIETERERIRQEEVERVKTEAKTKEDEEVAEIIEAMSKSEADRGREVIAVMVADKDVIAAENDIQAFLDAKVPLGQERNKIRAYLVEYEKFKAERTMLKAA